MPTIFRHAGLRIIIYVDDHPPPHVHVAGHDGEAKIALDGPVMVWNRGIASNDLKRAFDAVRDRLAVLKQAWIEIHGRVDR